MDLVETQKISPCSCFWNDIALAGMILLKEVPAAIALIARK